jgi:dTDP-4-amino-4,6-dideoxygalactose transaminase
MPIFRGIVVTDTTRSSAIVRPCAPLRLAALGYIPFNRPYLVGREQEYVLEAFANRQLSADGAFTKRCSRWLEDRTGSARALLTHSCTAALELIALLLDVEPGDEVIMPSFTFVSTANGFALRGGVPVFVDIRPDTLNIDETKIEDAITPRTKAIVAVHYAGVACAMDSLTTLANDAGIPLVEDAAHAIMAEVDGQPLGAIGALGALSFHETKNVTCGEGGALLVNDPRLVERAEIVRDKGTNRKQFFRGQVDKYSWLDVGSSFGMSELGAAFLWAQLLEAEEITARRLAIWDRYQAAFAELEAGGRARRPIVPEGCAHNGHLYYLLVPGLDARSAVLSRLNERDVNAVFHYVPLHSSEAGLRYGRTAGDLSRTTQLSERLLRLPLWTGMSDAEVDRVIDAVRVAVSDCVPQDALAAVGR